MSLSRLEITLISFIGKERASYFGSSPPHLELYYRIRFTRTVWNRVNSEHLVCIKL